MQVTKAQDSSYTMVFIYKGTGKPKEQTVTVTVEPSTNGFNHAKKWLDGLLGDAHAGRGNAT